MGLLIVAVLAAAVVGGCDGLWMVALEILAQLGKEKGKKWR